MDQPRQPRSRSEFEIALICALPLESHALKALFDGLWDGQASLGKAAADPNAYTLGWIAGHNVVLTHTPGMGPTAASAVAANCRVSFQNIKLALVVGICGGTPTSHDGQEILLGDVVISTAVIQYTLGRQFPDGIERKDSLEDNLGRPNSEIRAFLHMLSEPSHQLLVEKTWRYLEKLQETADLQALYPGSGIDYLYQASYRHKHQNKDKCPICATCVEPNGEVCAVSRESNCDELGCSNEKLVHRRRKDGLSLNVPQKLAYVPNNLRPKLHFGRVASGNLVMKSGLHRDELAVADRVIAFEMEAAGVWDSLPTIVVKGICDYADSHKNKIWQRYAAASAAACTKALLTQWRASDLVSPRQSPARVTPLKMGLPYKVSNFVGRAQILAQLDNSLFGSINDDKRHRVLILQAMGGQGKTQLALQACKRVEDTYGGIFWIDAKSRTSLELSFESLAELVFKELAEELNLKDRVLDNSKAKLKFALDVLQTWRQRWLLVLDNYDEMDNSIRHFIPSSRYGTVIITSRHEGSTRLGKLISVPSMASDNGKELLLHQFWNRNGTAEEHEQANKIIARLGGLALALDLAASYLNYEQIQLSQFIPAYESMQQTILEHEPELFEYHAYPGEEPVSAFTIWEMSFKQIKLQNEQHRQYIEDFLAISACFDPRNITEDIFAVYQRSGNDLFPWQQIFLPTTNGDEGSNPVSQPLWDSGSFQRLINQLCRISLLLRPPSSDSTNGVSFSIHPVIRDWLQKREKPLTQRIELVRQAFEILTTAIGISSIAASTPHRRKWLIEHLDSCQLVSRSVKLAPRLGTADMRQQSLAVSDFFRKEGQYSKSQAILELLVQNDSKELGELDEDRLASMSYLACTYLEQGRWNEAEALEARVVENTTQALGEDHTDTLINMNILAMVLERQGKYATAEQMHRRVLKKIEALLGKEHPKTLISMSNLMLVLFNQSRYEEAEQIGRYVLEKAQLSPGLEDTETLISANNFASVLEKQGKYKEAEQLDRQTLAGCENKLGEEHPITLTSMSNLASVLQAQGQYEEAEHIYRRVLLASETARGKTHPDTLISKGNLAMVLTDRGKYKEAEETYRLTIVECEETLRKEHPRTLTSMNNLSLVLYYQSKYKEAEELALQVVEKKKTVLGEGHVDTLKSRNNLAQALQMQGKHKEAEDILRQVQLGYEATLGKEHPLSLMVLNNLAICLSSQRSYEEAELMYRQAAEGREKVLGKDHSETLACFSNLASVLSQRGKYEAAVEMNKEVLERRETVLGKDHPDTLMSANNLAEVKYLLGKFQQAEQIFLRVLEAREKVLGEHHSATESTNRSLAMIRETCHNRPAPTFSKSDGSYDISHNKYSHAESPLHSDREIRLISLLPRSRGPNIKCEIETVPIDSQTRYEALSYAWGQEPGCLHLIQCNGKALAVYDNLWTALYDLRHDSQPRTLWIDSICINQADEEEKNRQVATMGSIYQMASRVMIWLGEADQETPAVFKFLRTTSRLCTALFEKRINKSADILESIIREIPLSSHGWKELGNLFKREWFSRMWVLQEMVLANRVLLCCGHNGIFLDEIHSFLAVTRYRPRVGDMPLGNEINNFHQMSEVQAVHSRKSQRLASSLQSRLSLTALLSVHRERLAKDPRDKIYALLGLAVDDSVQDIRIDYRSPWQDVYRDATRSIIACNGHLYILCLVEIKANPEHTLPSWVPDFRSFDPLNFYYQPQLVVRQGLDRVYFSSGATKASPTDTKGKNELALRGIYIGKISRITDPAGHLVGDIVLGKRVLDDGQWARFAATCATGDRYAPTGEHILTAYRRIRIADLLPPIEGPPLERSRKMEQLKDFPPIPTVKRVSRSSLVVTGNTNSMAKRILKATTRRRMFVTDTGYLGLAHRSAAIGDKVFVVLGADAPLILRPQEPSKYTFLGEAYVHGIMYGEALTNARKSKDPAWDSTDPSWLEELENGPYPFDTEEVILV